MKTKNFTSLPKALMAAIIFFTAATVITSCTKDPIGDQPTPAYVTAINASITAGQDFYVDNAKINNSTLGYAQSIGYISYTPGVHQLQFKAANTTTVNSTANLNAVSTGFYTAFYTDDKSTVILPDDRVAPASTSQSRVRFVNLASANITFDVGLANSSKRIATGLPYKTSSSFLDIDAGTTFTLYSTGGTTSILSIPAVIAAGHIYTIFIAGSTQAALDFQMVTQD